VNREALRKRSHYKVWRSIQTRWHDNDAYGHVNNTVHYQWFDTAVNGWLIEQGLLDITAGPSIGLVVESGCTYAGSVSYPAVVEVGLAAERIGTSSVRYRLSIFGEGTEEAAAEGFLVHVYVSRVARRPVPIPREWRTCLERIRS